MFGFTLNYIFLCLQQGSENLGENSLRFFSAVYLFIALNGFIYI